MDATERELADLLRRRHEADAVPPLGLAARVLAGAAERRRRNRARVAAATAALSVVVVAAAVLWPVPGDRSTGPVAPTPVPPSPSGSSSAPPVPSRSRPFAVSDARISRVLAGSDARFTAFSIDRDGTIAGTDVAYGPDGFDRFSRPLVLDVAPPEISDLGGPDVEFMPALTADRTSVYSLRHTDPANKFDLWCTDRATGRSSRLSTGSVWEATVHTDRGNVVWSYYGDGTDTFGQDEVWTASGCGPARKLPATGAVVAVDWPLVYLRDPDVAWGISLVDAVSLASTPVPPPVADVPGPGTTEERSTDFAAKGSVLAWVLDREVRYLDLRTGRVVRLPDLPAVRGVNGVQPRITVGDRTLAVFARGSDAGPDAVAGYVHDLPTGETEQVAGDAWAAGPWVVTGSRDSYRLRTVR